MEGQAERISGRMIDPRVVEGDSKPPPSLPARFRGFFRRIIGGVGRLEMRWVGVSGIISSESNNIISDNNKW